MSDVIHIENISELINPADIDVVVTNHAETDHSGALPAIMHRAPKAEIIVSKRGAESVEGHYHKPWKFKTVRTGAEDAAPPRGA